MNQKRQFARVEYEQSVELVIDGTHHKSRTVNISQGGALLNSNEEIPFAQKMELLISLPRVTEVCRIPCIVRWSNERAVGVQFETLRPIEVWAIGKMIKQQ